MTSSAPLQHCLPTAGEGFCARCGHRHALPRTAEAEAAVRALIPELESLWKRGHPLFSESRMVGVLLGIDGHGRPRLLRAFSGAAREAGWADPPLPLGMVPWKDAAEAKIGALTNKERDLWAQAKRASSTGASPDSFAAEARVVRRDRRVLSRRLMVDLTERTLLENFRGDVLPLAKAFKGSGIPSGTGECCAPKLLGEARRLELRPEAMAEMWWVPPGMTSKSRAPGELSRACARKCEPILGFILCGAT